MAALVAEADARGLPVEAARAERAARAMDRREFLRLAALAGAGAAVAGAVGWSFLRKGPTAPPGPPPPVQLPAQQGGVAIVGAGLAGLTCAYRLQARGVEARIYEASPRVGGRCWTLRGLFAGDQFAEHGGELIDSGHEDLLGLAEELGLEVDDLHAAEPEGAAPVYHFDGAAYTHEEATRDLAAVWSRLQRDADEAGYPTTYRASTDRGRALDAMSVAAWLDDAVPGGRGSKLGRLLDMAYTLEFGAPTSEQSALNLVYLLAGSPQDDLSLFGESDERYRVRGGNERLVEALAARLQAPVETRMELTALARRAAGGYDLTFKGPEGPVQAWADRVVLTVPFAVLRRSVDLAAAGFRDLKMEAIRELGMGRNTKLHAQFVRRYWHPRGWTGETYTDAGFQSTWDVSRAQPGEQGLLVFFTGADVATATSEAEPKAHAAGVLLPQLETVLPGAREHWNGKAALSAWERNAWSRGSYSFYRVGQYVRFAGIEAEPEGAVHFAGEHTSLDYQGYLNGAVASGARAAAEVAEALGRAPGSDEAAAAPGNGTAPAAGLRRGDPRRAVA